MIHMVDFNYLILSPGAKALKEVDNQIEVILNNETTLKGDIVILAIGVTPDTAFLKDTGIDLGPRGNIIVNDKMHSNLCLMNHINNYLQLYSYLCFSLMPRMAKKRPIDICQWKRPLGMLF